MAVDYVRPRLLQQRLVGRLLDQAQGLEIDLEPVGGAPKLDAERVRLLVACGAAAAIGGTFNAPIAGVMFAMEIILGNFDHTLPSWMKINIG